MFLVKEQRNKRRLRATFRWIKVNLGALLVGKLQVTGHPWPFQLPATAPSVGADAFTTGALARISPAIKCNSSYYLWSEGSIKLFQRDLYTQKKNGFSKPKAVFK